MCFTSSPHSQTLKKNGTFTLMNEFYLYFNLKQLKETKKRNFHTLLNLPLFEKELLQFCGTRDIVIRQIIIKLMIKEKK